MSHGEVSEIIPAPSQAVFDLIHDYGALGSLALKTIYVTWISSLKVKPNV